MVFPFRAAVLLMKPHTQSPPLVALGSEEYVVLGLQFHPFLGNLQNVDIKFKKNFIIYDLSA